MNTHRGEWRVESGEGGRFGIWDLGFGICRAPSPDPRTPPPHARRGVLLLVVLAILALFALIAVAFVVLSGQAQRSAKSIERFEQVIDPPEKLLHQAAMQVFRGPTTNYATGLLDQSSVMQAHSLLEDIYGDEPLWAGPHPTSGAPTSSRSCVIMGVGPACGGQLVEFTYQLLVPDPLAPLALPAQMDDPFIARRLGCVITFIKSPNPGVVGQSTRLVGFNPSDPGRGHMLALGSGTPAMGDEFTINGVPFSGTGFGYDSNDHDLDLAYDPTPGDEKLSAPVVGTTWPVALLPNLPLSIYNTANPAPSFKFGGANEDYDAADFQNMLLAAQVPNPAAPGGIQTLPSLHRPALVRYWMDQLLPPGPKNWAALWNANRELCRKIMLRPIGGYPGSDHPNFTGSNPNFNPAWDGVTNTGNQWDVDNDGDGVTDSVWVDLGMPVRATTDGRLYKPLFAILCVDLDGRLNLNAHGSLPQTDTANYGNPIFPIGGTLAVGGVSARGQGLGPADINLGYLLGDTYPQQLMSGILGSYQGRYGVDGVLGVAGMPGTAVLDTLNANKWFEYGSNYWDFTNVNMAGSFGSPPDVFGVGAVGLDLAGRPLYIGMNYQGLPAQYVGCGSGVTNSPYELNLDPNQTRGVPSSIATVDNPFSPAELERILRPFDRDAPSLPDRLAQLSAAMPGDTKTSVLYNLRHSLTTESWDLPCPNVVTPSSLSTTELGRLTDGRVKHITDLLLARGVPASEWAELLPADLLAGLRMNINRPLGNGRADDTNNPGVVDAPAIPATAKTVTLSGQPLVPVSYDGSGLLPSPLEQSPLGARQLMARQLYVLVFTLADRASLRSHFGDSVTDTARAVAQWAVNVVDFRDRDNIMTPFNFDPRFASDNPIAGWNPPNNARYIAWGCERPELLITETTAFHDRKTEDTKDDPTGMDTLDTPDDDDFDQKSKPQGSLFVELYNPAGPFDPPAGGSYESIAAGGRNVGCVRLNQTTPGDAHPVWRLLIAHTNSTNDPDHPTTKPAPDRSVYFADPTTANPSRDGAVQYYTTSNDIAPVLPGRYAVIGPATETLVGTRTDTLDAQTRKIKLMENVDPDDASDQVSVERNRDTTSDINDLPADTKPPVAVVVNHPRRMSVSEPTDGYSEEPDGTTGFYEPPKDQPFDEARGDDALKINGTTPNYRIVHLQRLANPRKPYLDVTAAGQLPTPIEDYNPYLTIDSQPIDLTVFNGLDSSGNDDPKNLPDTVMFASRQRGETNVAEDGVNNLWKQDLSPNDPASDPTPKDSSDPHHIFKYVLRHTLGYLNEPFGPPRPDPNDPRDATNGWRSYRGDPATGPFPWLTWNNRPYVSQLELMLVSWVRSSQLLRYYNIAQPGNPYTEPNKPFPHLMNLFPSNSPSGTPNEELHRVLEYLGVPSPFVGTGTWANPNLAKDNPGAHTFHPPFSRISAYREPGRINLNTIYSQGVFDGLMNGFSGLSWARFVQSRRHDGQDEVLDTPATNCPTEFSRPFRSFGGASLVPTLTGNPLKYDREIDATLLREGNTPGSPLFQHTSPNQVNHTDRNPYFRYQGIQRLGNLVTTRSNVYAVWITVGYFEVTPVTPPDISRWPDGYQLGRELGMDTGEIERHRAFYIFDRSIPVGFQRGQDLNVEKAILVDRYIE